MLRLEDRRWKMEDGEPPYSVFHIPSTVFNWCVQAVSRLGIVSAISGSLRTAGLIQNKGLWVSGRVINRQSPAFTSPFALFFKGCSSLLGRGFIPTFHSTYNYNNELYKLITIVG